MLICFLLLLMARYSFVVCVFVEADSKVCLWIHFRKECKKMGILISNVKESAVSHLKNFKGSKNFKITAFFVFLYRHDWRPSPLRRCSTRGSRESAIADDHGRANIQAKHPSGRASGTVSQSHFRASPWLCDPSNGERCINATKAGELMKRVAGWHFQTDEWSGMAFTQERPRRLSFRRGLSVIWEQCMKCKVWLQHDSDWHRCQFLSPGIIWLHRWRLVFIMIK